MPKIMIAQPIANKKVRKAETSEQRMKALLKKRCEKFEETEFTVVTIDTRMTLAVVRDLMNSTFKRLKAHEGCIAVERYTINPETMVCRVK